MQNIQESLRTWATLLGTTVSFIGLIQSRTWLAGITALCLVVCIVTAAYAKRERRVIDSASVTIEGQNIDCLNIANLRRRVNTSLVIQQAHHTAKIEGENLTTIWRYSGFCNASRETVMEFSIDAENNVPFHQLNCFGYDLAHDPAGKHKIRPVLIGADGISKKIALPFLAPLADQQAFSVLLQSNLPGCMQSRLGYYTSTFSFACRRRRKRVPVWRSRGSQVWGYALASGGPQKEEGS
jgi:hypothetical protein